MKKRLLASLVVMLLVMGVFLPACSVRAEDKVKLSYWHAWSGDEAADHLKIIERFNESQDKIEIETLDSQTTDLILAGLSGSDGPDIIYNMDYRAQQWGYEGFLADITDELEAVGMDLENIHPGERELVQVDGRYFGVPFTMDTYALFSNQDILDEFGFEPPSSLEEMLEQSKEIATKDGDAYTRVGYVPDFPWIEPLIIPLLFGGDMFDFDAWEVGFTSDNWIEALEYKDKYYSDFGRDEILQLKSGFGAYDSPENPFFQGKVAFAIEGEWYPTFIERYAGDDFHWGQIPLPPSENHEDAAGRCIIGGGALMVNAKSEHKAEAVEFINFLKEDTNYLDFCIAKGSLPTTMSAMESPRIAEEAPALAPFVQQVLDGSAQAMPPVPFSRDLIVQLRTAEEMIYSGELEVADALQEAADELEDVLDEYRP